MVCCSVFLRRPASTPDKILKSVCSRDNLGLYRVNWDDGVNWEDGVNRVDVVNGVNAVEWDEVGELD